MIKLTEKSRRIIRAIFRGIGAAAAALTISACPPPWLTFPEPAMYGPGPDRVREEVLIRGIVKSKKTGNPISGIAVYINVEDPSYHNITYGNGEFHYYVYKKQDSYTIIFTDIDGDRNGGRFKQHTLTITAEEAEALGEDPLIIELEEEVDEE